MNEIEITRGDSPLVLGLPHTGTYLPGDITGLNDTGLALADTDWHIHDLYAGLVDDITTVRTRIHRYAIDANRDPSGESLYPGQNTTTLYIDGVKVASGTGPPQGFEGFWRIGRDTASSMTTGDEASSGRTA